MANYYGLGRTNYVKIKNIEALREELANVPADIDIFERDGLVAFSGYQNDDGVISYAVWTEDDTEVHPFEVIASHMEEDQILVYMEAGSEKARYVHAHAMAMDYTGREVLLELNSIYAMAAEAFDVDINSITEATY